MPEGGNPNPPDKPGQFVNHEVDNANEAKRIVEDLLQRGFAVQITGYKEND